MLVSDLAVPEMDIQAAQLEEHAHLGGPAVQQAAGHLHHSYTTPSSYSPRETVYKHADVATTISRKYGCAIA